MLRVFNKDGEPEIVSNQRGLGIRTHEEVMTQYGYSHSVIKNIEVPAGEYALLTLEIPVDTVHHSEFRILSAYNSPVESAILPNYTGSLPTVVSQLPAWNAYGAYINNDVLSVINYRGTQATNPLDVIPDETICPEFGVVRATTGVGVRLSTSDSLISVKGRYYPSGIHCAWVHNIGSEIAYISYQYGWHEYEE